MRTVGDARYRGKWRKDGLKIEMLVGQIGKVDKFHTYELKTSVRPDVYVPASSGLQAVSQDEFRRRLVLRQQN
jgi:hypothetical protein